MTSIWTDTSDATLAEVRLVAGMMFPELSRTLYVKIGLLMAAAVLTTLLASMIFLSLESRVPLLFVSRCHHSVFCGTVPEGSSQIDVSRSWSLPYWPLSREAPGLLYAE